MQIKIKAERKARQIIGANLRQASRKSATWLRIARELRELGEYVQAIKAIDRANAENNKLRASLLAESKMCGVML